MPGTRWLVALALAIVVSIGSQAGAQVFKPRSKTGQKAGQVKKATPATNQARTTTPPAPRRVTTTKPPAKAAVAKRPAPKKAAKGKKASEDEIVVDDDDDDVSVTDDE